MNSTQTTRIPRELAAAGYGAALLLLILPLSDTLLALIPHSPGDVGWRFGAFGLVSRALVSPVLALFLLLFLSTLLGHERPRRLVGFAGLAFCVLVAAALPLFVLDALQMRASVLQDVRGTYDVTVLIALAKYLCALLVVGILVRAARIRGPVARPARPAPDCDRELLRAFRATPPLARGNGPARAGSEPGLPESPLRQPT